MKKNYFPDVLKEKVRLADDVMTNKLIVDNLFDTLLKNYAKRKKKKKEINK